MTWTPPDHAVEILAVDGAALLDEVEQLLLRFVAYPSPHCAVAVTLWAAHTHVLDAFDFTPRLVLTSPTKQSGKSRTLELLDALAARARSVASMSTAYLFRSIEANQPTVLFDEIDTVFGPKARDNEELRALINQGHRRGAVVGRCVGEGSKQVPKDFPVFTPIGMAGIGDCVPETVLDRAVVLRMRKRAPDEPIEPYELDENRPQARKLHDVLAAWAEVHVKALRGRRPKMPDGIVDRPADVWRPLLAVAEAAGGTWPERGRAACEALNQDRAGEDPNVGIRLLSDIAVVLGEAPAIHSVDLCAALNGLEESGWSTWSGGNGIRPLDLARRLKGFGVHSKDVRIGDAVRKGYVVDDPDAVNLRDAFSRYFPDRGYKGNKGNAPGRTVADVALVAALEPDPRRRPDETGFEFAQRRGERAAARIAARNEPPEVT